MTVRQVEPEFPLLCRTDVRAFAFRCCGNLCRNTFWTLVVGDRDLGHRSKSRNALIIRPFRPRMPDCLLGPTLNERVRLRRVPLLVPEARV